MCKFGGSVTISEPVKEQDRVLTGEDLGRQRAVWKFFTPYGLIQSLSKHLCNYVGLFWKAVCSIETKIPAIGCTCCMLSAVLGII